MTSKVIHLIYIHGFRGDDTTFQSFPSDLQQYLSSTTPQHLSSFKFRTSLYPTYKSVKPISHATKNFLEWLSTQPPDPVIVLCHSMGGLLGAEAFVKSSRIVGMVSFDTPYLGMHPHVVISGIASLLPKDDEEQKNKPTEREMNPDPHVKVVDSSVTDDWEAFKKNSDAGSSRRSSSSTSSLPSRLSPPFNRTPSRSRSPSPVERALEFLSEHQNDPLVRWFKKHSDEPFTASKRWVVEHFQFGICMFDPVGLRERYAKLVEWRSDLWVNYFTQTRAKVKDADDGVVERQQVAENDLALLETGITKESSSKLSLVSSPFQQALLKQEVHKNKGKVKAGRHFIVLPTGLGQYLGGGDKWEKVLIEGVEDEVAAHCGLFIRGQNLDYEGLVDRVGRKVFSWCEKI